MTNPTKLVKRKFKEIKKADPGRAARMESRLSGEIYDLRPLGEGYGSGRTIKVVFKEGVLQYVD